MMAPVQRGDVGVRAGQGHQSPDDAAQRGQPFPEPLTTARRAGLGKGVRCICIIFKAVEEPGLRTGRSTSGWNVARPRPLC